MTEAAAGVEPTPVRCTTRRQSFAALGRLATERPWVPASGALCLSLLVIAIVAIRDGVQLTDERAIWEIRARDVLTDANPMLSTRSSASGGSSFAHPGPLQFELLAVPVRLLGGSNGTTIAVIATHIVVIVLAVVAAHHVGGPRLAVAVTFTASLLCWTLGIDNLIDPWQPQFLVIPAFGLFVVTAAVVGGGQWWLAVSVCLASLCAQSHISYLLVGPTLVGAGAVAGWWSAPVATAAHRRHECSQPLPGSGSCFGVFHSGNSSSVTAQATSPALSTRHRVTIDGSAWATASG